MKDYPFLKLAGVEVGSSEIGMMSERVLDALLFHYLANLRHYTSNPICAIGWELQLRRDNTSVSVSSEERRCSTLLTDLTGSIHDLFERVAEVARRPSETLDLRYEAIEQILANGYRRFVEEHIFLETAKGISEKLERIPVSRRDEGLIRAVRYSKTMLRNIEYLETLTDFEFENGSLAPNGSPVPHIKIPKLDGL